MAATPTAHIRHIDGVRAVAVGSVVLLHYWEFYGSDKNWFLNRLFDMGGHGVDLFFIVSGFCLAYPILRTVRAGGEYAFSPSLFYAKRIVRILPPYYAILALLAIALPLLSLPANGMNHPAGLIQQMFFLDRNVAFLNRSFWTLAVEFRWYLVFPLLALLYLRSPRAFVALGVGLMLMFSLTRVDAIDFGTLPAFMLGIWAADCHITAPPSRKYALPVFCVFAVLAFLFEPTNRMYYADEPLADIAVTAFVVASGVFAPLHRLLTFKPLIWLGICSYSVYLVNDTVLEWSRTRGDVPGAAALALALAVSVAFWWLFERPTTSTALRGKLVGAVQGWLDALLPRLGVPARVAMAGALSAIPVAGPLPSTPERPVETIP